MSAVVQEFATYLTKEAKDKNQKSYLRQMAILAPAAGIQAVADIPRGMIDKAVENKIAKIPKSKRKSSFRQGIGRGAGRLGAGLVTTPLFLSGIKQIKNAKNKKDRDIGMAKVIAGGGSFSAIKGLTEGLITEGANKKALRKIKDLGKVRGLIGLGAASLTGIGLAKAKASGGKKKSKARQMAEAAGVGLGVGAGKGALEGLYLNRKNLKNYLKTPRRLGGAAAGRGVAGAIGATLLSEIADKYMTKVSFLLPKAHEDISIPAHALSDKDLRKRAKYLKKLETKKIPYRQPFYYTLDEMKRRKMDDIPKSSTRDKVDKAKFLPSLGVSLAGGAPFAAVKLQDIISPLRLTGKESKEYADVLKIVRDAGVSVYEGSGDSHYKPFSNRIHLHKPDVDILLHEYGHAKRFKELKKDPAKYEKIVKRLLSGHGLHLGGTLLSAITASNTIMHDNLTEKELQTSKNLNAVAGIGGTLLGKNILIEEALANKEAIKTIKEMSKAKGKGSAGRILKYVAKMLPAQSTYLSPIIGSGAAVLYLDSKQKALAKKRLEKAK